MWKPIRNVWALASSDKPQGQRRGRLMLYTPTMLDDNGIQYILSE